MVIGIVTLWNTNDNYGGILQTYALQRYLRNKGHRAYIVRMLYSAGIYFKIKSLLKKLLIILHCIKPNFAYRRQYIVRDSIKSRRFYEFRNEYISLSSIEYHSMFFLRLFYPKADVYITGSDQVWGMSPINQREAWHYLDFGKKETKRVSYAASFGRNTISEEDLDIIRKYLYSFDRISVRELSGVTILKKIGFDVCHCIDSTLLLGADDYIKIMSNQKHKSQYAYVYSVNMSTSSEIYWNRLKKVLASKGLKTVVTTASGYLPAKELFSDVEYDYASPSEWLSNIYYSNVVITSSFHGIVFSIIFRKQFIYFPLKSRFKSGNDRITDLLKLLGLNNRTANTQDDCLLLLNDVIDYDSINLTSLNLLIRQSKEYLDFVGL